jgi:hypothetical protein
LLAGKVNTSDDGSFLGAGQHGKAVAKLGNDYPLSFDVF